MKLYEIICPVLMHVEQLGAAIDVSIKAPTKMSRVDRFEFDFGLNMPDSIRQFYTDVADGLTIAWHIDDYALQGRIEIASLKELRLFRERWLSGDRGPKPESKYFDDIGAALTVWERMANWIPIWDEGNGDLGCIDTNTGQVVYHAHDWWAPTGNNGNPIEANILSLIENWSRVSFAYTPDRSWRAITSPFRDAVDWGADDFDPRCRVIS